MATVRNTEQADTVRAAEEAREFGDALRETRVTHGRELADVADHLRIRKVYLQAIEEGRFDDLPGPTYAAGFVRAYADYLGLDVPEVVRRYKLATQGTSTQSQLVPPSPVAEGRLPTGSVLLVGAILAAAVYGGWYYLSAEGRDPGEVVAALPQRIADMVGMKGDPAPAAPRVAAPQPARPAPVRPAPPAPAAAPAVAAPPSAATAPAEPSPEPAPPSAEPTPPSAEPTPPSAESVPSAAPAVPDAAPDPQPAPPPAAAAPETAPETVPRPAAPETEAASPAPPPEPPSAAEIPPAAPPPSAAAAPPPPPPSMVPAAPESSPQVASAPPSASSRVVLRATSSAWVELRDGAGRRIFSRLMRSGETFPVPPGEGVTLTTGNAGGLDVLVDGRTLPPLGPTGGVRRDVVLDAAALLSTAPAP